MIVVIEGMDAAGKATHSKLLAERLKGTRFSFPNYESETGKAILAHLKKEWHCTAMPEVELSHLDGGARPNETLSMAVKRVFGL